MIKVKSSVTYPSKTVPGRNHSTYKSTPIADPTASKLFNVLQDHIDSIQYHINASDTVGLSVKIIIE